MQIITAVALLVNDVEVVYIENLTSCYLVPLRLFLALDWKSRKTRKVLAKFEISHTIADLLKL